VIVCAVKKQAIRPYIFLNIYMAASLFVSIGSVQTSSSTLGLASNESFYFLLLLRHSPHDLLYFALTSLLFKGFQRNARRTVRQVGRGCAPRRHRPCFRMAWSTRPSRSWLLIFVLELQQNLYFVGLVIGRTCVWAAVLKLQRNAHAAESSWFCLLESTLSLLAANYALRNLYPGFEHAPSDSCRHWSAASCRRLGCMRSGGFRKKRASFRRVWRCSDDGRFLFLRCSLIFLLQFFISYCRSL